MSDQEQSKQAKSAQEQTDLDPFEIDFLPQFEQGRGPHQPFVNEHGVVIGDHEYASENSPLEQWTSETDPEVMAGDEWVHPYKDVGFQSSENRDYFEKGVVPQSGIFMHPDKDVSYEPGQVTTSKKKEDGAEA